MKPLGRQKVRSLIATAGAITIFAVSVLVGPLTPASADDPSNSVTIEHTPPPTAVAGDPLPLAATFRYTCPFLSECRRATQRLVYFAADGTTRKIERTLDRPAAVEVWNVSIPGDAVRFPQARYHFEVDFSVYWKGQDHWDDPSSDRLPVTGEYTVNVTTVLRFTLTKPDGTPASNVKLSYMVEGSTADAAWLQADSLGRVVFNVPMSNPTLAATSATTGYGFIHALVFDSFPAVTPAAPTNISGLGTVLVLQINTGNPRLSAVQYSLQDATIPLVPMSVPFGPRTASTQPGVVPTSQRYESIRHDALINIGGAQDWWTSFNYSHSLSTTSTYLFESGVGEWVESKAEMTSKQMRDIWTWIQRGPYYETCAAQYGLNWQAWCWNARFTEEWDFVREDTTACSGGFPGTPVCWTTKRIVPDLLTGFLADPVPDAHNAFTKGPDCFTRLSVDGFRVGNTRTQSQAVDMNLSYVRTLPKPVHMGITLRREDSHQNSTEYEWHIDPTTDAKNGGSRYHYLFVRGGLSGTTPQCPFTHPDLAWTATTTQDLGV